MTATADEKTTRQQVWDLWLTTDLHRIEIRRMFAGKVDDSTIARYITQATAYAKENGITVPTRRPPPPRKSEAFSELKELSPIHVRVGARLSVQRSITEKLEPRRFVSKHNFANQKLLRKMEQGFHDFTLSELQQIAEIMGTDLLTLLAPKALDGH